MTKVIEIIFDSEQDCKRISDMFNLPEYMGLARTMTQENILHISCLSEEFEGLLLRLINRLGNKVGRC